MQELGATEQLHLQSLCLNVFWSKKKWLVVFVETHLAKFYFRVVMTCYTYNVK